LGGKFYCKPHFKQLFKLKGNYDEGFGRERITGPKVKGFIPLRPGTSFVSPASSSGNSTAGVSKKRDLTSSEDSALTQHATKKIRIDVSHEAPEAREIKKIELGTRESARDFASRFEKLAQENADRVVTSAPKFDWTEQNKNDNASNDEPMQEEPIQEEKPIKEEPKKPEPKEVPRRVIEEKKPNKPLLEVKAEQGEAVAPPPNNTKSLLEQFESKSRDVTPAIVEPERTQPKSTEQEQEPQPRMYPRSADSSPDLPRRSPKKRTPPAGRTKKPLISIRPLPKVEGRPLPERRPLPPPEPTTTPTPQEEAPSVEPVKPAVKHTTLVTQKFEIMSQGEKTTPALNPPAAKGQSKSFYMVRKEFCADCTQIVYPMEKIVVSETILHKRCFKCKHCTMALKLNTYACLDGEFFCKPHYAQLFKLKGNYSEGFGKEKKAGVYVPVRPGTSFINVEKTETSKADLMSEEEEQADNGTTKGIEVATNEETSAKAVQESAEKLAKEKGKKEELERVAKEKADREAKEKAEREANEKAERESNEKAEREAKERMTSDRVEKEAKEITSQERVEREAKERIEKERAAREAREKAEQETAARENAEREAKLKAAREVEREAKEKADKVEREAKEKSEKAAREKAELEAKEKAAKEKAEKEAKEKAAKEKAEKEAKEKAAKEKAEREAREKIEKEKATKEKAEREATEKIEKEKAAKEKTEREAREKIEKEKTSREAREKEEQETAARENAEREAKLKAAREAEREAKEKAERTEREAKERADREARERAEKELQDKEELDSKHKEAEKALNDDLFVGVKAEPIENTSKDTLFGEATVEDNGNTPNTLHSTEEQTKEAHEPGIKETKEEPTDNQVSKDESKEIPITQPKEDVTLFTTEAVKEKPKSRNVFDSDVFFANPNKKSTLFADDDDEEDEVMDALFGKKKPPPPSKPKQKKKHCLILMKMKIYSRAPSHHTLQLG